MGDYIPLTQLASGMCVRTLDVSVAPRRISGNALRRAKPHHSVAIKGLQMSVPKGSSFQLCARNGILNRVQRHEATAWRNRGFAYAR